MNGVPFSNPWLESGNPWNVAGRIANSLKGMRQVEHRDSKGSIISISIDGALQLFTRDVVPFSNG